MRQMLALGSLAAGLWCVLERDGIYTMLKARLVMKEGRILVDKRTPAPVTDKRVNR